MTSAKYDVFRSIEKMPGKHIHGVIYVSNVFITMDDNKTYIGVQHIVLYRS